MQETGPWKGRRANFPRTNKQSAMLLSSGVPDARAKQTIGKTRPEAVALLKQLMLV